jgi:hypothetical protein
MDPSNQIGEHDDFRAPAGPALSLAVGFFLAFRAVIPLLCVRVLGTEPQVGAQTKLALNFLVLGLVCFASTETVDRTLRSMLRLPSMRWVFLYLGVSGCSLLWSATASLPVSFAYWCGTLSDVAIAILLFRAGSVTGVANSLMKGFVWGACCIAIIAWMMPTQFDLRLGDEDYLNSNTIGNICAFAFFFAQYLLRRKDGKWTLAACFLSLTLLRSLSKSTIAAFLVSGAYLLVQDRSMSRRSKLLFAPALALVIVAFWGLFKAYYDFYTTYGNEAETLTGRTAIWTYALDAGLQQPWIGHGFDSMWKVVPVFGTFEARHAENELLEQFYSYGVAGVVMLCGLYGSLYRMVRRLSLGPLRLIVVSIVIFVIVRGFAVAEPFDLLLPLWMVVMIAMLASRFDPVDPEMCATALPEPLGGAPALELSSDCNF